MSGATADQLNQAESNILEKHRGYLAEAKPNTDLLALNQAALERFETLGFPHRKHEMYTFVNTTEMASTDFSLTREGPVEAQAVQSHLYPGCEKSCLVLVDGRLSATLSDTSAFGDRLKVSPLADALSDASLQQYILDTIENENDVFACINSGSFNIKSIEKKREIFEEWEKSNEIAVKSFAEMMIRSLEKDEEWLQR